MLSLDYIRAHKDEVAQAARNKNREVDLDGLLSLDSARRELIVEIQALREERNMRAKQPDADRIRGKALKEELHTLESSLREIEQELQEKLMYVPNVPLPEVPVGKDETGNKEIKTWGTPRDFDFPIRDHVTLGEYLGGIDTERGSKIAGFRGYFVMRQLAQLEFGLLWYVFQKLAHKGYTPVIAPSVVKEFTLFGSAHFPWGRTSDVYQLQGEGDENLFLSGTAEIPVTAFHSGEILSEKDLPKRFVALSPCFRREAGAYGKDTRGIVRVHEFWKIEQVVIAQADIDMARQLHSELQANGEEVMQDLELPYRVLLMCTGDMGEPQMLKYDTEVWMPSENAYREVGSNSIMGDFQARRLDMRYRASDDSIKFCYTLNNTALASTRPLLALLENHQQKDGSIRIPKALQSVVGFDTMKPL